LVIIPAALVGGLPGAAAGAAGVALSGPGKLSKLFILLVSLYIYLQYYSNRCRSPGWRH
jgi:hypothetical protein